MTTQINYPHLASMVFNTPLMCTTQLRDAVQQAILPRLLGNGVNVTLPDGDNNLTMPGIDSGDVYRMEGSTHHGVAVIPVHGIMTTRRGGIDAECREISSYERINGMYDAALESDQVEHIVLDCNTPGGSATGCFDLAERIYQSRGEKPVTAVINFSAFSAGYMIASAADEIIVPETGGVGSIGVIASHIDMSQALELNGLKITTFYRGYHKNDLTPYEPISDDAAAALDAELDDLYALFVERVARNRGLSTQAVIDTQASTYRGANAVNSQLADDVMYPQIAVNQIAQGLLNNKQSKKRKRVGVQAKAMALQAQI